MIRRCKATNTVGRIPAQLPSWALLCVKRLTSGAVLESVLVLCAVKVLHVVYVLHLFRFIYFRLFHGTASGSLNFASSVRSEMH